MAEQQRLEGIAKKTAERILPDTDYRLIRIRILEALQEALSAAAPTQECEKCREKEKEVADLVESNNIRAKSLTDILGRFKEARQDIFTLLDRLRPFAESYGGFLEAGKTKRPVKQFFEEYAKLGNFSFKDWSAAHQIYTLLEERYGGLSTAKEEKR